MRNKSCKFKFERVSIGTIDKLRWVSREKTSGVDNFDVKLLKPVAEWIALPIYYIINLLLEKCIHPSQRKIAKIVSLAKNNKEPFKNSWPISLILAFRKIKERMVYEQIQKYLVENDLNTVYQHACKKGHSRTTALTEMTVDWLKEM